MAGKHRWSGESQTERGIRPQIGWPTYPIRRCEGRKPYGYFEGEAETLQRIRELRGEGLGYDRIAERLNTEGFKARTGGRWHGLVVNRILTHKPHASNR